MLLETGRVIVKEISYERNILQVLFSLFPLTHLRHILVIYIVLGQEKMG